MTRKTMIGLAAAASLAAALPSGASAATVTSNGSGGLVYQAAPGEKNGLSIQYYEDQGKLVLFDRTDVKISSYPASCEAGYYDSQVWCDLPSSLDLDLADGDDYATPSSEYPASVPLHIAGGAGDDQLSNGGNRFAVNFDGGPGNDTLKGGKVADVLNGGDGNDEIAAGEGADRLDGGAGDDTLTGDGYVTTPSADVIEGGPGRDKIESDWSEGGSAPADPISITLGGGADDGRPGEADDVHGVESIHVNVPGSYTGSDADEEVVVRQILQPTTLRGMGGNDILKAGDGSDELDGGAGADFLDGGFGDDHLVGGPGADIIHGDIPGGDCGPAYCKYPYGNDTIDARDGEIDSIDCGPGEDRVNADANDVVAPDCEIVARGASPGPGPKVDDPQQPAPNTRGCVVPKVKKLKLAAAKKKLAKAGCRKVKVRKVKNRKVGKGRVVKATVRRGVVTLTVSRGRR